MNGIKNQCSNLIDHYRLEIRKLEVQRDRADMMIWNGKTLLKTEIELASNKNTNFASLDYTRDDAKNIKKQKIDNSNKIQTNIQESNGKTVAYIFLNVNLFISSEIIQILQQEKDSIQLNHTNVNIPLNIPVNASGNNFYYIVLQEFNFFCR